MKRLSGVVKRPLSGSVKLTPWGFWMKRLSEIVATGFLFLFTGFAPVSASAGFLNGIAVLFQVEKTEGQSPLKWEDVMQVGGKHEDIRTAIQKEVLCSPSSPCNINTSICGQKEGNCLDLIEAENATSHPCTFNTGTDTGRTDRNGRPIIIPATLEDKEKQKLCKWIQTKLGIDLEGGEKKTDCDKTYEEFKEAKKDAGKECGVFGGLSKCREVIISCEDCPDGEGENCVKLPAGTKCPELAGEDLAALKEEKESAKDIKNDVEGEIKELKDKILEKNAELTEAKTTYDTKMAEMQNEVQSNYEELEREVKEKQGEIDGNLQKANSEVRGGLSKSLEQQHVLSNAIAKAERVRRDSTEKIYEECRRAAAAQLSGYRQRRRVAIRDGRYRNRGVGKMMRSARVSFAKRDNARYQGYYSNCVSRRASRFQSVEADYRTTITMIEQKKEQLMAQYRGLQGQIRQLTQQAFQQKQKLIQEFSKNTESALQKLAGQQMQRTKKYEEESRNLNHALMALQSDLQKKKGELKNLNSQQGFRSQTEQILKRKGVSSKDGKEDKVSEARASFADFIDTIAPAFDKCCPNTDEKASQKCEEVTKKFNAIYSEHIQFDENEGTPGKNRDRVRSRTGGSR